MVKLQLWDRFGAIATFGQFPLWHGKVATYHFGPEFFDTGSQFPLWHGKVATYVAVEHAGIMFSCFRFGMVKLQLYKQPRATVIKSEVSALAW